MTIELRVPDVGESIQEVQIAQWLKAEGDPVAEDENIVELETDKASMELPSPAAGILKIVKQKGETAAIGETIAYVAEAANSGPHETLAQKKRASATAEPASPKSAASKSKPTDSPENGGQRTNESATSSQGEESESSNHHVALPTPSARRALREHGLTADEVEAAGKQLRREDVLRHVEQKKQSGHEQSGHEQRDNFRESDPEPSPTATQRAVAHATQTFDGQQTSKSEILEEVVPMTLIRKRIAERLVEAQHNAALLTTYNEIDMTAVMALRKEFGEKFRERHGVKLGFMSFFAKAVVDALQEVPELNAEIRGTNIVYRHRYDIGIAIGSDRGLVVPVLRNVDRLSFAEIEMAIADFAVRANSKRLVPKDLAGGTFTISNGGIYGSLLSTPIVNPPQSGVLGMHTIQDRPVARDGQVVIRPMMYVALTYDHRIIDGKEAVTWLKRVKDAIEQPARILIEA